MRASFGDAPGANTIGNVAERVGGLRMPNFERLGLGRTTRSAGLLRSHPRRPPSAGCARSRRAKDTITGHWEMAGIVTEVAFPTYPDGFPAEVSRGVYGDNRKAAAGQHRGLGHRDHRALGAEHQRTGRPILYTSADSVFQVAAHEETVPLATLYEWCERARAMLVRAARASTG